MLWWEMMVWGDDIEHEFSDRSKRVRFEVEKYKGMV